MLNATTEPAGVRILVCGDDELARAGLAALLAAADGFAVVGLCGTASALAEVGRTRPDVTVLAGHAVPAEVHGPLSARTRVVAFAGPDTDEVTGVLAIGARAVLPHGAGPGQLVRAIRVVADSDTVLMPLSVHRHVGALVRTSDLCQAGAVASRLTAREADVLALLADGLSNAEVASSLFVSAATVRTHVHHILRKLAVRSRAQAVAVAYRAGTVSIAGPATAAV